MYDSFLHYNNILDHDEVLCKYGLSKKQYVLVTIHRAENTDNKDQLSKILSSLRFISQNMEVILPLHPRTKKMIKEFSISTKGITIVNPISYFSIIALLAYAKVVITDSGGLQKEAYYSKTPCLTIRDETEWVETLENKWNQLVSLRNETDLIDKLEIALKTDYENTPYEYFYGSGNAANIVISSILDYS
jgi:UDP-N-acetylglucosamine 2-epimerase